MTVPIRNDGINQVRADVLLANANPTYSRASLVKLFELNQIKKNNIPIKPGDKIKPGETILSDLSMLNAPADPIDMPIIFENPDVIVVDKPVGVISHARGKYWDEPSVASFIRSKVANIKGERAGIVHRLDRATSGVMICAKNAHALSYLQKQFSARKVAKIYVAIIKGRPKLDNAIIDAPILRSTTDPKMFCVNKYGKEAMTEYNLTSYNDEYSLLELRPKTGRTHQIRVHLKYIKHPIVGDELYGGEKAQRMMLHAKQLEITIPSGDRKIFESKIPEDFDKYL